MLRVFPVLSENKEKETEPVAAHAPLLKKKKKQEQIVCYLNGQNMEFSHRVSNFRRRYAFLLLKVPVQFEPETLIRMSA